MTHQGQAITTRNAHMYTQEEGKERKTVDMSTSNINTGDRKAFYEQLTADNAAVLLVDHQVFSAESSILMCSHSSIMLSHWPKQPGC